MWMGFGDDNVVPIKMLEAKSIGGGGFPVTWMVGGDVLVIGGTSEDEDLPTSTDFRGEFDLVVSCNVFSWDSMSSLSSALNSFLIGSFFFSSSNFCSSFFLRSLYSCSE